MTAIHSRSTPEGFAERTLTNLYQVVTARKSDPDRAHEVTQLANSLLGLIIFPFSEGQLGSEPAPKAAESESVAAWSDADKPVWQVTTNNCTCGQQSTNKTKKNTWKAGTIRCMVYHVRNAAAHGRLKFSGNER